MGSLVSKLRLADLSKLKILVSWPPAIISKLSHHQGKHLLSLVFPSKVFASI